MNKCCKSLFYKGLSLSKDLNNSRVLSTMLNYSALGHMHVYFPYEHKFNSKLFESKRPVLFIHSHKNHLARNSKKSTSKHQQKKTTTTTTTTTKLEPNLSLESFNKEVEIDHYFKPISINPILKVDKDNIGIQLGGNISKCE